tara:strand:+ start:101 stop:589 length:489 start_codon:yes stop_codon:yes gene_type:complete
MLAEESKSICKYCCSEMSQEHSRCAQCRRAKKLGWLLNGERFYFILAAWFAVLLIRDVGVFSKHYNDYSAQITSTYVSQSELKDGKYVIVFRIDNETDSPWHQIKYQLIGKTDRKVSHVFTNEVTQWWVQANSQAYLTVTLDNNPRISQWDLRIKDLSVKEA